MKGRSVLINLLALGLLLALVAGLALAQGPGPESGGGLQADLGTRFTYQGRLIDGDSPAEGDYDFRFILYDAEAGGSQVGGIEAPEDVAVSEGLFTVALDFGSAAFDGQARWLEIEVRPGDSGGDYTTLSPRQALTAAPYALYARGAPWGGLSGVPAGFADGTDDDTTYTAGAGLELTGGQFSVNTGLIQARVTGSCPGGNAIRVIHADGTVTCEAVAGGAGDITAVHAGDGLTGGGTTGEVTLAADLAGSGFATSVARSDHEHDAAYVNEGQAHSVTTGMILNGTITADDIHDGEVLAEILDDDGGLSGLDADLLDGQHAGEFAPFAHGHDDRYYTKTQLQTSGSASVHWGNLTSVPAGFADGVDDDELGGLSCSNGQVAKWTGTVWTCETDSDTTYTAGTGLTLTGSQFSVNTGLIQVRVTGSCTGGNAIRIIHADGTVTCEPVAGGAGDITAVHAGDGLTGGGTTGEVTLAASFAGSGSATTVARSDHHHDAAYVNEGQSNSVTTGMIVNGTVTADDLQDGAALAEILDDDGPGSGLNADLLDGQQASAFASAGHDHDSSYYTKTQLQTSGSASVHWGNLTSVPAGFADGVDDDELGGLSCSNGQVAKWNSTLGQWQCADDQTGAGGSFWSLTGNAGTTASNFLGTTDNRALELRVNNARALRLEPNATSPNVIGGYGGNSVTGGAMGATIGGGGNSSYPNQVTGGYGTVGGGRGNSADEVAATVGGGEQNTASGEASTIAGGVNNTADVEFSSIGGGSDNVASELYVTVSGGNGNQALNESSAIGGGADNIATGWGATIGGGIQNDAGGDQATIGGGRDNTTGANYATVAGGRRNTASAEYATVAGGYGSEASGYAATIAGGFNITATADYATVGGGLNHTASGDVSTVGGGQYNIASGHFTTIGGGLGNTAGGQSATVGGGDNNQATGHSATVPGGRYNTAQGDYSFAAGYRAKANHQGSFVLADSTEADFASVRADALRVRFNGGATFSVNDGYWVRFWSSGGRLIDTSTNAYLSTGGTWTNASDRESKENFAPVDGNDVLARLAEVPIQTWNYKAEDPSVRHLGPVAQDFHAAFGLGEGDKQISTVDAEGVALAAIQALHQRNEELAAENAAQQAQITDLEARVAALEQGAKASDAPLRFAPGWLFGGLLVAGLVLGGRWRLRGGRP